MGLFDKAFNFIAAPVTTLSTLGANELGKKAGAGDIVGGITGQTAAEAARRASMTSAQAQMEALDYLKQQAAIPTELRDKALTSLGEVYGGTAPTVSSDEELFQQAMASPLLQGLLGQSEEAILRQAGATGGLRSGNVQSALAGNTQNTVMGLMDRQRAIEEAKRDEYLGGLSSLSGLQTYVPQISSGIAGIGQTLAQGQVGSAQAQQQGISNMLNLGGMILGGGI